MQLIYPTSGRAEILGRPVGDVEVRRRIGYLPENPYFYDYLTAEELLGYFAGLFGYRGRERGRAWRELLDEVGIGAERRLQLRKFSKGMLQRVGIAQALLNDPDVVFFDEPMSGLDPLGRREIRELILRLRDRGCTVFFSSHVLADAETLCSRVAIARRRTACRGRRARRTSWHSRCAAGSSWSPASATATLEHAKGLGRRVARTPLGEAALCAGAAAVGRSGSGPREPDRRTARSSCRSIRFARRSRTSSSGRLAPCRAIGAWNDRVAALMHCVLGTDDATMRS